MHEHIVVVLQLRSLWSPWLPPKRLAPLQRAVAPAQIVKLRRQVTYCKFNHSNAHNQKHKMKCLIFISLFHLFNHFFPSRNYKAAEEEGPVCEGGQEDAPSHSGWPCSDWASFPSSRPSVQQSDEAAAASAISCRLPCSTCSRSGVFPVTGE